MSSSLSSPKSAYEHITRNLGGDEVPSLGNQLLNQQDQLRSNDDLRYQDMSVGSRPSTNQALASLISLKSPKPVSALEATCSTVATSVSYIKRLSSIQLSSSTNYQQITRSSNILESPLLRNSSSQEVSSPQCNKTYFQLKFLPKYITEQEVFVKISRFGEPVFFHFLVGENIVMVKPSSGEEAGCIPGEPVIKISRQAVFSFQADESLFAFGSLNRIRIKGLQVKISKLTFEQAQEVISGFQTKKCSVQTSNTGKNYPEVLLSQPAGGNHKLLSELEVFHCSKPTGKLYFALRHEQQHILREACRQGSRTSSPYMYRVADGRRCLGRPG